VQARSALFDLYGDHLRSRGGQAPVAALVQLMDCLDVAAPAVRTAISRMVRQGWLMPVATPHGRGYGLTERATRRLDEAAVRIYRHQPRPEWDGHWSVALVGHSRERTRRERMTRALEYLGYRQLDGDSWVAPWTSPELAGVVGSEGLSVTHFCGTLDGDERALVERLWHPDDLAKAYRRWTEDARQLIESTAGDTSDRSAFMVRSMLLHEWRKFLFTDPGLPRALLPAQWPGDDAAAYFDTENARLGPGAARFVDDCLARRIP